MAYLQKSVLLILILCLATCMQCTSILDDQLTDKEESQTLPAFHFPSEFDFSTKQEILIQLAKTENPGKYIIRYFWNDRDETIGTFNSKDESNLVVEVPKGLTSLTVDLIGISLVQSASYDLIDQQPITVQFTSSFGREANGCQDRLYAVESSSGGFWEIDLKETGYTERQLPNLEGGGSIACALDQTNNHLYYNVNNTLYRYDVNTEAFEVVFTSNPFGRSYPRFEYKDGIFYMGNGTTLYKVDASTNQTLQKYDITGFVNNSNGGDLAFASDGTLYLACFSGLYRFESFDDVNGSATISRISAENFPYKLTSMAIDRKDQIFVATNESQSRLLRMNVEDGSHEQVTVYNHKINDLTAWKCSDDDLEDIDTDGDGVIDELDDYPKDAEVCFTSYTPSELGKGSLAFEDLWPAIGDYDFNDLVIHYKYIQYINAENKTVRMKMIFDLMAMGATFHNGFGIELPMDKSYIESVSGFEVKGGEVSLDAKGLESGQSNPVIIVFDDAYDHFGGKAVVNTDPKGAVAPVKQFEILVEFTQPMSLDDVRSSGFNPFIFINSRSIELHLRNKPPTDLANLSILGTESDGSDAAQGKFYRSQNNAPWAIDLIHAFRYPKESSRIDRAYKHFLDWANSDGTQYADWYTDANGNRTPGHIYNY